MKAIKITKHSLATIESETGIRKESLGVLAQSRDVYMVLGPEVIYGRQTYQESIFNSLYRFTDKEVLNQFAEVTFN